MMDEYASFFRGGGVFPVSAQSQRIPNPSPSPSPPPPQQQKPKRIKMSFENPYKQFRDFFVTEKIFKPRKFHLIQQANKQTNERINKQTNKQISR